MYACVGLWAQFFLILYAATELSNVMRFATRCGNLTSNLDLFDSITVFQGRLKKFFRFLWLLHL